MQGQPRHELTRLREKGYLHEAARDAIKEYIVANSLRAGDALPSEGELADTFGVSRNSVREGVKAIETLGIIEVRAGLGLYVKDFSFSTVLGHLAYGLMFNSRPLVEILEARTYLEIGVAHRVVASATPAQLRELEASLGAMSDAAREGRYSRKEDEHFHDVLFQEVKNDIVHSLLEMFWEVLNVSVQHAGVRPDPIDPMKAYLSHELIVAELKRGDADGFSKAVLDHYAGLLHRLGGSTAEWLDANRFLAETSTDRPAMT